MGCGAPPSIEDLGTVLSDFESGKGHNPKLHSIQDVRISFTTRDAIGPSGLLSLD